MSLLAFKNFSLVDRRYFVTMLLVTETINIRDDNDVIICSHAIEHLSDIRGFFEIVALKA